MTARPPEPTYYSTGRTRRAFLLAGGAALLASAAGLALWGTGVVGGDAATAAGDDDARVARASPEAARRDAASPPPSAMEDVDDQPIGFTTMAMVGDSITEGSTPALTDVLTKRGFTSLDIRGRTNRRIREGGSGGSGGAPVSGMDTLGDMLADGIRPQAWVIALGTNDVGQYDEDGYRELIDEVLGMIDSDVPVVWVDTYRPDRIDESELYNRLLRERIERRGNGYVADWFSRASDRDLRLLRKDGLHPNERGQLVFADLVGRGLAVVAADA